jgi:hypothetical protein
VRWPEILYRLSESASTSMTRDCALARETPISALLATVIKKRLRQKLIAFVMDLSSWLLLSGYWVM